MGVCAQSLSRVQLLVTPWTVAHQALLSMGFSGQGYWSGLPCSPPGDSPNPGTEPRSPAALASACMSPEALASACISKRILYHCTTFEALIAQH